MRHLEPALDHREGQLALDQFQRIAAELFELATLPAAAVPLRWSAGQRFQIIAAAPAIGLQISISRLRILSSSFRRSATSAPSLPSGAPRGARGGSSAFGQRLCIGNCLHQAAADVVVLPPGGKPAHLGQLMLFARGGWRYRPAFRRA